MRGWSSALVAALALTGCNGPKSTCEESVKSFYNLTKNHNWDGMFDMLTPEHKRKVGSADRLAPVMEEEWKGSKNFSVNYQNIAETKSGVCIASGTMTYTIKIRGDNPYDVTDSYFSWTLKQGRDGLWYIDLPGSEKLTGY